MLPSTFANFSVYGSCRMIKYKYYNFSSSPCPGIPFNIIIILSPVPFYTILIMSELGSLYSTAFLVRHASQEQTYILIRVGYVRNVLCSPFPWFSLKTLTGRDRPYCAEALNKAGGRAPSKPALRRTFATKDSLTHPRASTPPSITPTHVTPYLHTKSLVWLTLRLDHKVPS